MSACLLHCASRLRSSSEILSSALAQGTLPKSTRSVFGPCLVHPVALVYVCTSTGSAALRIYSITAPAVHEPFTANTQGFYFCRMSEDVASTQLISAQSRDVKSDVATTLKQVQFHLMSVGCSPKKYTRTRRRRRRR